MVATAAARRGEYVVGESEEDQRARIVVALRQEVGGYYGTAQEEQDEISRRVQLEKAGLAAEASAAVMPDVSKNAGLIDQIFGSGTLSTTLDHYGGYIVIGVLVVAIVSLTHGGKR